MNKLSFWIINFILCSNFLKYPIFLIIVYIMDMELPNLPDWLFNLSFITIMPMVCLPFLALGLYIRFKTRIFIFCYKHSKEGSYTRNFFEKFKDDDEFQESVITRAMAADTIYMLAEALLFNIIVDKEFGDELLTRIVSCIFIFLILGTGVFLSYESLSRWFAKQKREQKTSV